jgi:phosphate transport system substrate-binding protein
MTLTSSRTRQILLAAAGLVAGVATLAACGGGGAATTTPPSTTPPIAATTTTPKPGATTTPPTTTPRSNVTLNGAGATFPQPLYAKWFDEYAKITGVKVNYQGVGSGGGIKAVTEGTVDFGASDGIMTAEQQSAAEAKGGPILHIPMTIGPVAIIYNVSTLGSTPLKMTPDVLTDIYLKKIMKWSDPRISSINPGVKLPDSDIAVVHRSDSSGTTYIFTNYLSKVSDDWKTKVGNATSVNWPGDIGGQGNAGVAGQVQQIAGSIGYVELSYALQNKILFAQLKNSAGNYITPSLASASKAADGVVLPDDMKVMVTNSSNADAYPIVGFTWMLAFVNQTDKDKGQALANMLWWAIHDGQQLNEGISYPKLPAAAVTKAENQIKSMQYQGQTLVSK